MGKDLPVYLNYNDPSQENTQDLKFWEIWPSLTKFDHFGLLNDTNIDFSLDIEFDFDSYTIA